MFLHSLDVVFKGFENIQNIMLLSFHLLSNNMSFYFIVKSNSLKNNVGYGKNQATKYSELREKRPVFSYTILFCYFPYLISYHTLDFS